MESPAGLFDRRQLWADRLGIQHGVLRGQRREVEWLPLDGFSVLADEPHLARGKLVGAGKIATASDRPGHRRRIKSKGLLDLVEQFERITGFAIHLVDERHDRNVAQAADLE